MATYKPEDGPEQDDQRLMTNEEERMTPHELIQQDLRRLERLAEIAHAEAISFAKGLGFGLMIGVGLGFMLWWKP